MTEKHDMKNLEQDELLPIEFARTETEFAKFETWVCFHRRCDYFEYRLKEGHTEDK